MTRNIIVASFLLQFLLPLAVYASQPRAVCEFYSKESSDMPAVAREVFNIRYSNTEAVRRCSFGSRTGWHALSYIRKGLLGVCSFYDTPAYAQPDGATEKWSFKRPGVDFYIPEDTIQMTLARADCPRHNDESYVLTSGISEGTFLAISQFIDSLKQNSQAEQIFYLPAIEEEKSIPYDQQLVRQAQRDKFLDAIRSGATVKLWSVNTKNSEAGGLRYGLSFKISEEQWFGYADSTSEGIRLFRVMKYN